MTSKTACHAHCFVVLSLVRSWPDIVPLVMQQTPGLSICGALSSLSSTLLSVLVADSNASDRTDRRRPAPATRTLDCDVHAPLATIPAIDCRTRSSALCHAGRRIARNATRHALCKPSRAYASSSDTCDGSSLAGPPGHDGRLDSCNVACGIVFRVWRVSAYNLVNRRFVPYVNVEPDELIPIGVTGLP